MGESFKRSLRRGGSLEPVAPLMRADLHVHSKHSGATDLPVLRHVGRESYSEPRAVYETALARGMDLVTLTDHDTVAGALELRALPHTFVSEEVTVVLPAGRQLHVNVFDITEPQHDRIAGKRTDPEAFFAYLAEEGIPASVNHLYSALTGPRALADLHLPLKHLGLIEALNGSMPASHNEHARLTGRFAGLAGVGGSDSHTLAGVARAFTTVAGARTKEEFLAGLRRGLTVPVGHSGSYGRLTSEVTRIFASGYADAAAELARGKVAATRFLTLVMLTPLLPLIPLVTAFVYLHERRFGDHHFRAFEASVGGPVRPRTVRLPRPALKADASLTPTA
jgi:predicted metal-dependent phosphoesterase TrpH